MPNIALFPDKVSHIPALEAEIEHWSDTEHRYSIYTGQAPLEDGAVVTDHAERQEIQVTLTGYISTISGEGGPRAAMEAVRQLSRDLIPITVITEWGTYSEMLITDVNAGYWGRGMQMRLQLTQIIRVGITDTDITPRRSSGPAVDRPTEVERGRVNLGPALPSNEQIQV